MNTQLIYYRRVGLVILALGLVVLTGCESPFDPASLITKPRILGIRAELPWLVEGESTGLSVLVVDPLERELSYHWEACLFTNGPDSGSTCSEEFSFIEGFGTIGSESTAEFAYGVYENGIYDETIDMICDELANADIPDFVQLPDCDDGLPVIIRLEVTVPGDDESDETLLIATKAVKLLRSDWTEQNKNPSIEGVSVEGGRLIDGEEYTLALEKEYKLAAIVPFDSSESFVNKSGTDKMEELLLSWFVTEGELEKGKTYYVKDLTEFEKSMENTLTTPKEMPESGELELYIAVRDGRGGVDWIHRVFKLAE